MPYDECDHCGGQYKWLWTECFDKFGFGDGDGMVMTETVAGRLRDLGYEVVSDEWGLHNRVIVKISKDGEDVFNADKMPEGATFGYDEPRTYLSAELIELLDKEFPDDGTN